MHTRPTRPVIAIDLGATNIRAAVFHDGKLLERRQRATPAQEGPAAVADAIAGAVESRLRASRRPCWQGRHRDRGSWSVERRTRYRE